MGVAWAVPGPDESPRRGSRGGEGEECCSVIGGWDGTQGAQSGFGEVRGHEKFFFSSFLCRARFSWPAALRVARRLRSAAEESAATKHRELQN